MESKLLKRQAEISSLLKENAFFKIQVDNIRTKFGSEAEIEDLIKMSKLKEEKVYELLADLDNNI